MDSSKHPLVSTLIDALLEERAKVRLLAEALGIDPDELDSPVIRDGLGPYLQDLRHRVTLAALAHRP